ASAPIDLLDRGFFSAPARKNKCKYRDCRICHNSKQINASFPVDYRIYNIYRSKRRLQGGYDFRIRKGRMVTYFTVLIRVIASLILAGGILAGIIALAGLLDRSFSIGFFDLLAQGSAITWLLYALATVICYFVLRRIPLARPSDARRRPDDEHSD
ncbi:MAG: hypothetical protein V3S44_08385, partial [Alphaproteobacteria bacterium]